MIWILAGAVITLCAVLVVLALVIRRMYRDITALMRTMAGMPALPEPGNSRVISPYKKKEGDAK